jgi:EAL domain-containing protein (putative c-di-GMP-specific phosphodiesterase class I)
LRTACQQLAAWRKAGCHVDRIAVNLSARQFLKGELVGTIRRATSAVGLAPHDLELELTETALLQNDEETKNALFTLSREGYRIALDDFGTGYCSLSYLQQFPIDSIKIDRSFVSDLAKATKRRDLVGGIIQLARRIGIDVVAEGVETTRQLEMLRLEGCDIIQGYLIGAAVRGDAFPGVVRTQLELRSAPGLQYVG